MDLANIVFNPRKPFTPIRIAAGSTNGRISSQSEKLLEQRLEASEKEMLEEDVRAMRCNLNKNIKDIPHGHLEFGESQKEEIYQKYKFDYKTQSATQLSVYASKNEILSKISEYNSIVIEGSTGCGKSTQVRILVQ